MKTLRRALMLFGAVGFFLVGSACEKKKTNSSSCVASSPAGVSTAPTMTFYYGATTDTTGTVLTNVNQMNTSFTAAGCGPFGVWESGNGGEVATEIEMRRNARSGVFAMADGIVTDIQTSSSPAESGEVEGVWVRYGTAYTIKYVHVVNPTVKVGDQVTAGQRLGVSLDMGGGQYFTEAELRHRSGGRTYAVAWSSMLSNASTFNALFGVGNCGSGTFTDTDGTSTTTAANWLNASVTSGQWDVTGTDQACSF